MAREFREPGGDGVTPSSELPPTGGSNRPAMPPESLPLLTGTPVKAPIVATVARIVLAADVLAIGTPVRGAAG